MSIQRDNIQAGIALGKAGFTPYIMTLPRSDARAIALSQAPVVGVPLALNGTQIQTNSGAATRGALEIPSALTFITDAVTDTFTAEVTGLNHLGEFCREVVNKTSNGVQTRPTIRVYSYINSIIVTAITVSANLRVGILYSTYTATGGDLATQSNTGVAASQGPTYNTSIRPLPLPFRPVRSDLADVVGIVPYGCGTMIASPNQVAGYPFNATPTLPTNVITYTATTATAGTSWTTVTNVLPGDVAYTKDGYVGTVTAIGGTVANQISVNEWVRQGVAGTPTTPSAINPLNVYRPPGYASSFVTATGNGWVAGHRILAPVSGIYAPGSQGDATMYVRFNFIAEPVAPFQYAVFQDPQYCL